MMIEANEHRIGFRERMFRVGFLSFLFSPTIYPAAAAIVVLRQHTQFTMAAWLHVLLDEYARDYWLFSAAPLVETALGIWLFSWRIERQSSTEQQARFLASVIGLAGVVAFSLLSAEEGLAAPILRLPGASTAMFAFFFLPTYGAIVFAVLFTVVWIITHIAAAARNRFARSNVERGTK